MEDDTVRTNKNSAYHDLTWPHRAAAMPFGVYSCDAAGGLVDWNSACLRLWGREGQAKSDSLSIGVHICDLDGRPLPPPETPVGEALRTGKPVKARELFIIRPDGGRSFVIASAEPVMREGGEIIGAVGYLDDITDRKGIEERLRNEHDNSLREKQHRYRQMLEALPMAIYTTDADGRITFFNQAAVDLAGRRPALGSDAWCVTWRLREADGTPLPHDKCPMAVALKEERAVIGVETIAERPDGTQVRFVPYPTPIFDRNGKLVGAVNMLVDVTESREDQLQLARLAAIVASSDDAIISKTLDGIITSWNAAASQIFGYTAVEMIGQHITRVIPQDMWSEEEEILARLRRGEHIDHFETVRIAKDGRYINLSVTISPIRDKSGKLVGASKVGRDITERKHFEKLQRLLIGELNHRVKNTLATVQSIANQTVYRAKSPGDFASSFSGRLQALARTHTLLTRTTWQGAELGAIVRDQLPFNDADDDRTSCSGPSVTLNAQAALHLGLVLHELATNAMKYGALSSPRGSLTVRWMVRASPERELIMQWEERGGPSVSVPQTQGFGTTLIERSLDAHGGTTSIHYEAEGVTCAIRLPLPASEGIAGGSYMELAPSRADYARPVSGKASSVAGRKVLVVDDEPLIAMDIVACLTDEGCDVAGPAATVEKALALIESSHIDAALLDANLAGDPVDRIASALTQRNIPFAFVSGYGREGLPEAYRQATLVKKPFQRQSLIDVVMDMTNETAQVIPLRKNF